MRLQRWFHIVRLRLRSLFRSSLVQQELDEEIRDHLDRRAAEFMAGGMTAIDARDAALRAFGGLEQRKEECRDARGVGVIEDFLKDLAYAGRMAARHPGFTAAAVLSLALGIGASTAIFSVFDALLLKPLPVKDPESLRVFTQVTAIGSLGAKLNNTFPLAWFEKLRAGHEALSDAIAFADLPEAAVADHGREMRASGGALFVSGNYFDVLDVGAAQGRVLSAGDAATSAHATPVVLSDAFWSRAFARDRAIVGRELRVNGMPAIVIGVTPPAFFGLTLGRVPDLFLPLDAIGAAQPGISRLANRATWTVHVVGRLRPGVSDALAMERLTMFHQAEMPSTANEPKRVIRATPVETGLSTVRARFARPLIAAMTMVGLLLLIACANVATMLISRASARKTEILIRSTMGAGRARLIRQFATEALLLAGAAAVIGIVCASWGARMLVALLPQGTATVAFEVSRDWRVLAFTLIVSIGAALASAIAPALHALRIDVAAALRDRWQAGGRRTISAPFVVAQVALALILVVASGLLARTLIGLTSLDPGYTRDRLIFATVHPGARDYRDARLSAYYRELFDRIRQTPGVRDATVAQLPLMTTSRTNGTVEIPGVTLAEDDRWVQVFQVGARYFATTRMTVIAGRDFTDGDIDTRARVAAISEGAARRLFGTDSPIGRTLTSDGPYQIVGVVADARYNDLREEPAAALFVPYTSVRQRPTMVFAARLDDTTDATLRALQTTIRELDPMVPSEIATLASLVDRSLAQERLLAAISVFFAGAALLLLVIGLYGVMAYWVADRLPEIGVRLALGAGPGQVRWTVLRQPLQLALMGIAIGVPIALAAARASTSFLFGLSPEDPITLAMAALLILIVSVAAGLLPAHRAVNVDPVTILRAN